MLHDSAPGEESSPHTSALATSSLNVGMLSWANVTWVNTRTTIVTACVWLIIPRTPIPNSTCFRQLMSPRSPLKLMLLPDVGNWEKYQFGGVREHSRLPIEFPVSAERDKRNEHINKLGFDPVQWLIG